MRPTKPQTPETALKRACGQLLSSFRGYYLPIPGGIMGTRGAPDWMVFYQRKAYPMEFKKPGAYLSPAQKVVKECIEATGHGFWVIKSVQDFVEALGLPVRGLF